MLKRAGVLLAGLILAAASVDAQTEISNNVRWSDRDDGWALVEISPGCHLIWYGDHFVFNTMWADDFPTGYATLSVRGACNGNGLAEGPVELQLDTRSSRVPDRDLYFQGGRVVRKAIARDGILEGTAAQWRYEELNDGRGMQVAEQSIPGNPTLYKSGCEYNPDGVEPTTQLSIWGICESSGGLRLRDEFLNRNGTPLSSVSPPVAPVSSPPPAASPPPASSTPAGNTDVWSRCINVTQYPRDGGIQTVWALNNTCNTTVIARFCFRAEHEAAGDPNLCRRREMRTQEIRPGVPYDFPFSLIPPGTGLTDGRVVRSNELLVSGFACTGGNFPSAYFDSDGTFRSDGC